MNKFKNKYLVLNRVKDPEIAYKITQKIEEELKVLFGLASFQEKHLVEADGNIRKFAIEFGQQVDKSKSVDRMSKTIDFGNNKFEPSIKTIEKEF